MILAIIAVHYLIFAMLFMQLRGKFCFTAIPKAQVSYAGVEDNPLRGDVKLAHRGA
jgi:hypothetical protein